MPVSRYAGEPVSRFKTEPSPHRLTGSPATRLTGSPSSEVEQDFDGTGLALIVRKPERFPVLVEREAVGDDRRHVDLAAADQVEVVLHGVLADAVPLFDAEGIGADQVDLLEV